MKAITSDMEVSFGAIQYITVVASVTPGILWIQPGTHHYCYVVERGYTPDSPSLGCNKPWGMVGADNGYNSVPSGPHCHHAAPLCAPANHLHVPGPAVSTRLKESERRMRVRKKCICCSEGSTHEGRKRRSTFWTPPRSPQIRRKLHEIKNISLNS